MNPTIHTKSGEVIPEEFVITGTCKNCKESIYLDKRDDNSYPLCTDCGLSERDEKIMNEAFMIGRIYAKSGEKESLAEIHKKLKEKCEHALLS